MYCSNSRAMNSPFVLYAIWGSVLLCSQWSTFSWTGGSRCCRTRSCRCSSAEPRRLRGEHSVVRWSAAPCNQKPQQNLSRNRDLSGQHILLVLGSLGSVMPYEYEYSSLVYVMYFVDVQKCRIIFNSYLFLHSWWIKQELLFRNILLWLHYVCFQNCNESTM